MKYIIDVANSEITWTGFQPGNSISGRVFFNDGYIDVNDANREVTGGRLTIDMSSIDVLDNKLDDANKHKLAEHLRSDDFFDATLYPLAEFNLLEVKAIGDRADSCNPDGVIQPTHEVVGEFNLKGIKQRVSALVNLQLNGRRMMVQTMFTLDRTMWGMDYLIDRSNGKNRVLPDMEVAVKLVADVVEQPLAGGSAGL